MKRIVVENPDSLGTINLHGLSDEKYEKVVGRSSHKAIPLRVDPRDNSLIILDGHHTAAVCASRREQVEAIVYEAEVEIVDPLQRLNFGRALGLHDTAVIRGIGTVGDMRCRYENSKSNTR